MLEKPSGVHLAENVFNEYLDQMLDRSVAAQVDTHLASCAACRAKLTELDGLFSALANVPEASLSSDLSTRIMAEIPSHLSEPTPLWVRPLLIAEAALAFVLVTWFWPYLQNWWLTLEGLIRTTWLLLPANWSSVLTNFQLETQFGVWPEGVFAWPLTAPISAIDLPVGQALLLVLVSISAWLAGNALLFRGRKPRQIQNSKGVE